MNGCDTAAGIFRVPWQCTCSIHSFIQSFYLHSGDPNTGVTTP
jgi:hypothetical protein